jgi:hypothetical protein
LFDVYRGFTGAPAAMFAVPVVATVPTYRGEGKAFA